MPVRFRPAALLATLCAALGPILAAPASAQEMDARYTLSMRGLSGGQIGLRAKETSDSYAVSVGATSSGLVGVFAPYRFEGQSQGRIVNGRHVSTRYSEKEDDGGEITESITRFSGTTPAEVTFTPPRAPRPYDIDPRAQSGVVDPLTGLYLVLRDTLPAGACNQSHDLFDGRHVSRLALGPAQAAADGTIRCAGEYRRIAGYRPKQMAERQVTPLTFLYVPVGNGSVRVTEVRSPTGYGEAVLRRR